MDNYRSISLSNERNQQLKNVLSIKKIDNNQVFIDYPHDAELDESFMQNQDRVIQESYHRFHRRLPQLIIQLDGISEITINCANYMRTQKHRSLYESVAFVLSKGDMSVLERHYLEQLLSNQLLKSYRKKGPSYTVGIFSELQKAKQWLAHNPSSNHHH